MERKDRKHQGKIRKNREGETYVTKQGCLLTIIKYVHNENITVQFNCGSIRYGITFSSIKKGSVENFYHRSVCGIGYAGEGTFKRRDNKKRYRTWVNMLKRCYEENPTYKDVVVCEEWHNFQNFAKWYEENWKPWMDKNWHLDKDILIEGNKVYSPETCAFVPQEINICFIKIKENPVTMKNGKFTVRVCINKKVMYLGTFITAIEAFQIYKLTKENYIKEVADKWKNRITETTYNTLTNYKIKNQYGL